MSHIHELDARHYCIHCLLSVGDLVDKFNEDYYNE